MEIPASPRKLRVLLHVSVGLCISWRCLLGEDEGGEPREHGAQLGGVAPGHVAAAAHVEGAERGRAVRDERLERARSGLEQAVYGEQLETAALRHGDDALVTD